MIRIRELEALRYMGWKGEPDGAVMQKLSEAKDILQASAKPRSLHLRLPLEAGPKLGGIALPGESIGRCLCGCGDAYVFAATLGAEVDRALAKAERLDISLAHALQAAAASAIECYCDDICARLQQDEARAGSGLWLKSRFSPGYGDLPLNLQGPILALLQAEKRIGLCVSLHGMLVPLKSVTAIIGLSPQPGAGKQQGCAACEKLDCQYRKTSQEPV